MRCGVSVFILAAGAGMGIGAGIDALDPSDQPPRDPVPTVFQMDNYRGRVEEAERNLQLRRQEMGAACLRLLDFYMPGEILEGTAEDKVVSDIMQAPDNPCGPTITETRAAYKGLLSVATTASQRKTELSQAEHQLISSQLDADELGWEHSSVEDGAITGGATAGFMGLMAGSIVAWEINYNNPPKPRKREE